MRIPTQEEWAQYRHISLETSSTGLHEEPQSIAHTEHTDMPVPDVFRHESTEVRMAIKDMQVHFLAWQEAAQAKPAKEGVHTLTHYEEWLNQETKKATRGMSPDQKQHYHALAALQDTVFRAWATGFSLESERDYALTAQEAVLAANASMLMANIHEPIMAQQAIEQSMAAAHEMARIHHISGKDADDMEEYLLTRAIEPAISALCDKGELSLAAKALEEHGMLLQEHVATKLHATLNTMRYHADTEKARAHAAALQKRHREEAYTALATMDESTATACLQNAQWCDAMQLSPSMVQSLTLRMQTERATIARNEAAQKQQQETLWYGNLIRMAIGDGTLAKNPIAALESIDDNASLDDENREALRNAILLDTMDSHDLPETVLMLQDRLFTHDRSLDTLDVLYHVAHGTLRCQTALDLMTLQNQCSVDTITLLNYACKNIDALLGSSASNYIRLAARNLYLKQASMALKKQDIPKLIECSSPKICKNIADLFSQNIIMQETHVMQ